MMKKTCLFFLLLLMAFSMPADEKEIFKKIPRDFDFVLKFDIEKLLLIKDLQKSMQNSEQFKDMQKQLKEKLGLSETDVEACYICGSVIPLFEMIEEGWWNLKPE